MDEMYLSLKWLHIVAAGVGFGSNVTHFFWLLSANADAVHRANILRLVKTIDDRLAVPAYVVAILCGVVMWQWRWPTWPSWIVLSLLVTLVLTIMGVSFGPLMKRWIRLAQAPSPDNAGLFRLAPRLTTWWAGIALGVLVVLYLMVWKPVLW